MDFSQATTTVTPKCQPVLAGAAAILVSVLVALGVLELGIRVGVPQNTNFFDDSALRRNDWEYLPNTYHPAYIGVPVEINNIGLRGANVEIPKPEGVFRIVTVGDSVTFGYGIRNEATFPKALEALLNAASPHGTRYEVVNAGIPATGLDYYDYFVRKRAATLQPDLILVSMAMNDIADYTGRPDQPPPSVRRSGLMLLRHSHLYNFSYITLKSVLYGLGILDLGSMHDSDFSPIQGSSPQLEHAWQSTRAMLDRILADSRQLNVELAVVLFPMEPQISTAMLELYRKTFHLKLGDQPLAGEPQLALAAYTAARGILMIDLLPVFRHVKEGSLYLRNASISYDPVHPSVLGHSTAAAGIFAALAPRIAR